MAMAEVYRPESEDRLSPYPRAPPPSPEAQHRAVGGIFEFPRGVFEGFGIDLRRRDFDFSENDEPSLPPVQESTTVRRSSPKRAASSDTDDSDFEQPGSPMKRMCSAPSTMPNSFEVQGFQPSLLSSSTSIGNGSLLQPVSTGDMKVSIPNFSELAAFKSRSPEHAQSHSHSTSPPLFQQQQHQATSPYSIPPRSNGSVTPTHQPSSQYDTSHLLSKSFDLHNVQSHFPAHFEVTPPPPEVRPTRSRTLDTTSYTDTPALRTRKVSLKRNYNELESDPNLQFPFDYSYSSTGSSGESDWVVIENDLSSYPQGKKACCQPEPLSSAAAAAMSKRHSANLTANNTGSPLHHHPQATNTTSTATNVLPFNTALGSSNSIGQDNTLLRSSQEATTTTTGRTQQLQHLGQSSSSPLGVLNSNTGADLSSFPGGSAASNGSGSHSPLHTQLGMIHESIGVGSSAELHNASSAGYSHMPTADAALAERSHHSGEFVPQWSMEMMDCGEYSMRLDSLDSMDCGGVNDAPATMQSISEEPHGDLNEALFFMNNYSLQQPQAQQQIQMAQQQQNHHHTQQYQQGLLNPGYITPQVVHNPTSGPIVRSQSSEASASSTQKPTRHSLIENYFVSYHQSNVGGGGGTHAGGGQQHAGSVDSSNVSKSL